MQNNELNVIAGGTIAPSVFVALSTAADHTVLQATDGAASAGQKCVGISQVGMKRAPGLPGSDTAIAAEAGDPIKIFGMGEKCPLKLGVGGATRGDALKSDASGTGIVAGTAADFASAIALESGAAGAIVYVLLLSPGTKV